MKIFCRCFIEIFLCFDCLVANNIAKKFIDGGNSHIYDIRFMEMLSMNDIYIYSLDIDLTI